MNVLLDANALLAVLLAEPAMELVVALLREGKAAMTGVNIAEVFDVGVRRKGFPLQRMTEFVEPLLDGPIVPIPVDPSLARRAGEIRAAHYHRSKHRISLADAVLLGAARPTDRIATADKPVLATAAELGIETIELPHSNA